MTFSELNLIEPLLRAVEEKGYTSPTPIQQRAIPHILEGEDIIGCAQTGTGKTAAFVLPLLQLMSAEERVAGRRPVRTLVLSPTRELAAQIEAECRDYARHTDIRHTVIFGGVSQLPQKAALREGVDMLIATPGRLLDMIYQNVVTLQEVRHFVLDEADRMLDMGFIRDIKHILHHLPAERQTLFFSATMPDPILRLADSMVQNPARISVTPPSSTVEKIVQKLVYAEKPEKREILHGILRQNSEDSVLVFSRTKHGADRIARQLTKGGIEAMAIHGDKSQGARERALSSFRDGSCKVLVATDLAARGLDISGLPLVINFDLPQEPETYVHRIGRTARAGRNGVAVSLCSEEERTLLKEILKTASLELREDAVSGEIFIEKQSIRTIAEKPQKESRKSPENRNRDNKGDSRRKNEQFRRRKPQSNIAGRKSQR